ncbi:hypothetical protein [uncultured Aquimarina sp.]|uniref:hypothetical protein n=1 Tax=uncultured Aquimarina sp. TaxID=575652 RepID=UPI002635B9C8|nr:hypothetical protein [uncultured Aquimarina sp.]
MRYPFIKRKYYFSLFKDIAGFIKNPDTQITSQKSTKLKIYDTIGLYILKMIFLIPVVLFFALVYDPENIQGVKMSERFSPLVFLLVGGFLLPLIEEVAFRLSLKFKPIYLALSISVFLYYFLTKVIFQTKNTAVDESFVIRIVSAIAIGVILLPILNSKLVKRKLTKFWSSNFRIIYYVSCIVFAWMHISKYELVWINIVLLPILTLPQLMSAIANGYIRVKFGFQYPLLFHMSNNLVSIGLSLLLTAK